MSKTIDYYHFLISPWSYLAIGRFNAIVARHNATVNYIPIAVMPTFDKMGGIAPAKRHPSRQRLRMDELTRWSKHLDIAINLQPAFFPADASTASKMVVSARNQGLATGKFSDAVLTAVWQQQKNIADADTLLAIADRCGMDGAGLMADAATDAIAKQFASDTEKAHELDVFGSPTYLVDGENFWGQDRLDFLQRFLAV